MERLDRFWFGASVTLLVVAIAGVTAFFFRHDEAVPVVISAQEQSLTYSDIHIDGAVANPGVYFLRPGDTVTGLIDDAGGTTSSADADYLSLHVPKAGDRTATQRIDINRADIWLLESLPGIGPDKAKAIVEFRDGQGLFRMVQDLLRVPGIGEATLRAIQPFITVGE